MIYEDLVFVIDAFQTYNLNDLNCVCCGHDTRIGGRPIYMCWLTRIGHPVGEYLCITCIHRMGPQLEKLLDLYQPARMENDPWER